MKNILFQTQDYTVALILRLTLGLVIFPHGAQKLLGWFGGGGFSGTMDFLTHSQDLPWLIAFLVIMLESIGSIALILGFATRFVAVSLILLALGIALTNHIQNGFFMNWMGNQAGEGFEYFILWIGIAISLIFLGGGRYSVDRKIVTLKQGTR